MATKIKLMRLGKKRAPYYRIVVADARNKRDGKVIETIGKYHPKEEPSFIEVDGERAAYWLGVGAQPTDPVERILKVTGDWQRFKGEAAPAPMRVAEPKADKKAVFEAAALAGGGEGGGKGAATTPAKKRAPKGAETEQVAADSAELTVGARAEESPVADSGAPTAQAASDDTAAATSDVAAATAPQGAVEGAGTEQASE